MSANRWKYFRWTPRTAWITFVYVVAIPSVVGYIGWSTEVSWLSFSSRLLSSCPRQRNLLCMTRVIGRGIDGAKETGRFIFWLISGLLADVLGG